MTSAHDDDPGIWQTYNHLMGPNPIWQPFASSTTFIMLVNAGLTGVFAALVAVALDAPARWSPRWRQHAAWPSLAASQRWRYDESSV